MHLKISGGSLGFAKCDDVVLDDLKRASNSFFRTSSARREKMGSLRKDEGWKDVHRKKWELRCLGLEPCVL